MPTQHAIRTLRLVLIVSVAVMAFALVEPISAQNQTCPGAPQSRLVVGRNAVVSPSGSANNLRDKPGKTGKILSQLEPNTELVVLAGPTCADNYAWWQVALPYDNTTTGWMAEGSGSTYYMDPTTTAITKASIPSGSASVGIQFENASLSYNGIWGNVVEADRVFGFKGAAPQDMPPFALNPDYIEFRFGPAPAPNDYRVPEVDVYPVDAYATLVASVNDEKAGLQKILLDQPTDFPYNTSGSGAGIPVLPIANAAQVIAANVKYVPFDGGTGVRFITFYAQDVSPITNDRIEYYYQGLTQDGKYWISARFPLRSNRLADKYEDDKDFPDPSKTTSGAPFEAYYNAIRVKLNQAQSTDFTPSLDAFDTLVQSISVH